MPKLNARFVKEFEDTRVLVTGCSGFVGTYLVERLIVLGAQVYGLDRRKASLSQLPVRSSLDSSASFHWMSGNLLDIASIARCVDEAQPDFIIHLAAQSYVPESFINPIYTIDTNVVGTANLLEVLRQKESDSRVVFAGSSEEYGLVFYSESQLSRMREKYGSIFPEPTNLPEIPIRETNPLRPMSPYAVSKVAGDHLMRNYFHAYGIETVVSRAFNHEGAGRGSEFVTSIITKQVMQLAYGETKQVTIGDVTSFRDWSHVSDIVNGYLLLAINGLPGGVYNQGSQRTNSVLSYILLALQEAKWNPISLTSIAGSIKIDDPVSLKKGKNFGVNFETTHVDRLLLNDELELTIKNKGLLVDTSAGPVKIVFDPSRFRPADVPILLSSTDKIVELGFQARYSLRGIVRAQLNYYLDARRRAK